MTNPDAPQPGELTDAELDRILAAANTELLSHIEDTADPGQALTAITTRNSPGPPPQEKISPPVNQAQDRAEAAAMISIRSLARDLCRVLNVARDLAGDLIRVLQRASDPDGARDITSNLARDINLARELDLALDRSWPSSLPRARSDLDLAVARDFAEEIDLDLANARDFARDIGRILSQHNLSRHWEEVRGYARGLKITLDLELDRARACVEALDAQQVDVSGADLSAMEITHLDALNGVIWTHQTTWPSGIDSEVRAHSDEIRPGTYQVRFGDSPDRHPLVPV